MKIKTAIPFLFYFFFFGLLYSEAFTGQSVFLRLDIYPYYYPVWKFAADQLRQGGFPFWNPARGFGAPFFANPQSGYLYPPALLWMAGDFLYGLNLFIIFHLAIAGAFTYRLLRDLSIRVHIAAFGGLFFGLSGYLLSVMRFPILLAASSYFPLALLLWRRALLSGDKRWPVLLAVSLCLQYLAGDPSIVTVTAMVLTLGAVYSFIQTRSLRAPKILSQVFLLGAGLAAFSLLSAFELLAHSTRLSQSFAEANEWGLDVRHWRDFIVPAEGFRKGSGLLDNPYAGAGVVLASLSSFFVLQDKKRLLPWLGLFVFGALLSMGEATKLLTLIGKAMPLVSFFRYPQRFFVVAQFAVVVLAAHSLEAWTSRAPKLRFASGLFALLCLMDLVYFGMTRAGLVDAHIIRTKSAVIEAVKKEGGLFRVAASPRMLERAYRQEEDRLSVEYLTRREQFFPNMPLIDGLHSLWSYESLYIRDVYDLMQTFFALPTEEGLRRMSQLNVKYLASPIEKLPGWKPYASSRAANIFENPAPFPRAFLIPAGGGPSFTGGEISFFGLNDVHPAPIDVYAPNRVRVSAHATEASYLILTDAAYPGWNVTVDGKKAPLLKAEKVFRAVSVPAGHHAVEWTFFPRFFWPGLLVSLASVAYAVRRFFPS